jgi:hypothetical protein
MMSAFASSAIAISYLPCGRIQKSGVVPKYRARQSAVSPVTARRALVISEIRDTGTRNASAFNQAPQKFQKIDKEAHSCNSYFAGKLSPLELRKVEASHARWLRLDGDDD